MKRLLLMLLLAWSLGVTMVQAHEPRTYTYWECSFYDYYVPMFNTTVTTSDGHPPWFASGLDQNGNGWACWYQGSCTEWPNEETGEYYNLCPIP